MCALHENVIKLRRMIWAGNVAHIRKMIRVYIILVAKCKGKRLLGRHRRRWEVNIDIVLNSVGVVVWIHLVQDRHHWHSLVNTVMNILVP
jgi:hypothetical protein